ncbi:MAG: hypothetical protein QOF55_1065 [Thermoleophilaceae bacterium]|nr:hypothetical protein [Thermoleophilaceae bacterium]
MKRFNLHTADTELEGSEPPGFLSRGNRFGKEIGAETIGGTVYDLAPGQAVCPYHFEYGDEEWLMVLTGNPVVRTPHEETALDPGDVVCFPRGPEGAHKVTNPRSATGDSRVLMISTLNEPSVAVYPDSDKVGVFAGDYRLLVQRDSGVDYWRGES